MVREAANFLVDVNEYHEAQMEKVRADARILAQRARLFKHDVELGPMSAYSVSSFMNSSPKTRT